MLTRIDPAGQLAAAAAAHTWRWQCWRAAPSWRGRQPAAASAGPPPAARAPQLLAGRCSGVLLQRLHRPPPPKGCKSERRVCGSGEAAAPVVVSESAGPIMTRPHPATCLAAMPAQRVLKCCSWACALLSAAATACRQGGPSSWLAGASTCRASGGVGGVARRHPPPP